MLSLGNRGSGGRPSRLSMNGDRGRLGPYRLCLELESGGMATVYLAHADATIAKQNFCALKVIHPHLEHDRGFVEMFVDEAEIAARIRHANVCGVLDYGVADGRYYIAMEYLLGESMAAVFRRLGRQRRVDEDLLARCVARALADACEGLHAAHELTDSDGESLHVVHRDVSPENVLLTYDGIVKVLDFGVASASRKRHRTRTGIVKGKFAYVAPEFLRGTAKPERRADIWGVGVVAWELLTGQRLFRRETEIETLRAVCEDLILPPSKARPGLPQELDDIIMRALSREPEQRYATARDFGKDLARFAAAGDPIVSSDLAEWMEELFPGGRRRNEQILDLAEQLQIDGADRTPPRLRSAFPDASTRWSVDARAGDLSPEIALRPTVDNGVIEAAPLGEEEVEISHTPTPSMCRQPTTEWAATTGNPTRVTDGRRRRPSPGGRLWATITGATAVGVVAGASLVSWGMHAFGYPLGNRVASLAPAAVAAPPAAAPGSADRAPSTTVINDGDGPRAALVHGEYVVEVDDGAAGEVVLRIHGANRQASRVTGTTEADPPNRPATPVFEGRPTTTNRAAELTPREL